MSRPGTRSSSATPTSAALCRRAAARLPGADLGDLVVDVPAESQVHRQVVRKRAETHPIAIDPVVRLHYVEVAEPDMHDPSSDFRRLQAGACRAMGRRRDAERACLCCAACRRRCARAAGRSPSRCAKAARSSRSTPGFADRRSASRSTSARRRSPPISAISKRGEVVASRRRDEPADPLRRGSDEPRLLRDDEPRRRAELTSSVREAMDALVGEAARKRGVDRGEILEVTRRRQSDHASPVPRARSDRARRRAFALALDGGYEARARELGLDVAPGAFVYACPASPAMSARTRRASRWPRGPICATN